MHGTLYKVYYLFSLIFLPTSIYGGHIPVFWLFLCFQLLFFWGDGFDCGYWNNCSLVGICGTTEWSFFIDSISFFRISISICNASFLLFSVSFPAVTSVDVFLLALWLRQAFKVNESRYKQCGVTPQWENLLKKLLRKDKYWHNQLTEAATGGVL